MKKLHCDICEKLLGEDPSWWNTLETSKLQKEFCSNCAIKVDDDIEKIITKFRMEARKK